MLVAEKSLQVVNLDLSKIDQYISETLDRSGVPGLSVAIVQNGETLLTKGYGVRKIGEDFPVNAKTLFDVGAFSSVEFTFFALGMLVDEGLIGWDDRMISLVPDFELPNDNLTANTTVFDIVSHRVGTAYEPFSLAAFPDRSIKDEIKRLKYSFVDSAFRGDSKVKQWGMGLEFLALSEIFPAKIGMSHDDFLKQRLFKPLGMVNTSFGTGGRKAEGNVAASHTELSLGSEELVAHGHDRGEKYAYSTADDIAKWLKFQLGDGTLECGERLISAETMKWMSSGFKAASADSYELFGLSIPGTDLSQGYGRANVIHPSGEKISVIGVDTYGTYISTGLLPRKNLGIAILTNVNDARRIAEPLVSWLVDHCLGLPEVDRVGQTLDTIKEISNPLCSAWKQRVDDIVQTADSSKKTSLVLHGYTGTFSNPLIGDMEVLEENGGLRFILGDFTGVLKHHSYDTFYSQMTMNTVLGEALFPKLVRFQLDCDGKVKLLELSKRLGFDRSIIFKRRDDPVNISV